MPTLYKTDGTSEEVSPLNGKNFTLGELRSLIGCSCIEPIYLDKSALHEGDPKGLIMIGDEEARLSDDARVNPGATEIYRKSWEGSRLDIVGNVVLCPSKMLK